MRAVGAAVLRLLLILTPCVALADGPEVRLGDAVLTPYVLLQADEGGTFAQNRAGGQATGSDLRRGRVGGSLTVADRLEATAVYDLGGAPGSPQRLYAADLATQGMPLLLRAGVFKPNLTLEYSQSAADTLFLERAAVVDVVGGLVAGAGRVGALAGVGGPRGQATVLLTGGRTGPGADSGQRAVLGRVAGLVVKEAGLTLHLGASAAWLFRVAGDGEGQRTVTLSSQPELMIDKVTPSLTTGALEARGAWTAGAELGLGVGPLWTQGEAYRLAVDRVDAGEARFSGWYVQAAYTLIGPSRAWDPDVAAWSRPKPGRFDPASGRWGAVEAGMRLSELSLDDADVRGGRQRVWAAVLNWFPDDHVRLSVQYQDAAITGGAAPRRLQAVAARGQVAF